MPNLSYNVKLVFRNLEDKERVVKMLEAQRVAFNECSQLFFDLEFKDRNIKGIHGGFYGDFRKRHQEIPSQIVIRAEQEVLGVYRSIRTNKHKITEAAVKRNLSIRLDKRIYSFKKAEDKSIEFSLTSLSGRVKCKIQTYDKINEYLETYPFCDPLIFMRKGQIFMGLMFRVEDKIAANQTAVGVDLGIRVLAATSEGNLYIDKGFNARKRKLRHNKDELKSAKSLGSKSAGRHLTKLRRKEKDQNNNFTHHLANQIIRDTQAGYIILEDLSGIKAKKNKHQNKNRISQIPLFDLKRILTYKAPLHGKQVETVNPRDTSRLDCRTNKKDGTRLGRRYLGKDGVMLDADLNAACNISIRSKHPVSYKGGSQEPTGILDGQGTVNCPIVGCLQLRSCEMNLQARSL